mmetsp:Transcript_35672/g.112574  ORF Transcript_35672/g.112574 Transcript_35672/m.112574 type:complete len:220 (-) Transcript_35672:617-1276(-)
MNVAASQSLLLPPRRVVLHEVPPRAPEGRQHALLAAPPRRRPLGGEAGEGQVGASTPRCHLGDAALAAVDDVVLPHALQARLRHAPGNHVVPLPHAVPRGRNQRGRPLAARAPPGRPAAPAAALLLVGGGRWRVAGGDVVERVYLHLGRHVERGLRAQRWGGPRGAHGGDPTAAHGGAGEPGHARVHGPHARAGGAARGALADGVVVAREAFALLVDGA